MLFSSNLNTQESRSSSLDFNEAIVIAASYSRNLNKNGFLQPEDFNLFLMEFLHADKASSSHERELKERQVKNFLNIRTKLFVDPSIYLEHQKTKFGSNLLRFQEALLSFEDSLKKDGRYVNYSGINFHPGFKWMPSLSFSAFVQSLFVGNRFDKTSMVSCLIHGSIFDCCVLDQVTLEGSKLTSTSFHNTAFKDCYFGFNSEIDCVFDNCTFEGSCDVENLSNCKFINCKFENGVLPKDTVRDMHGFVSSERITNFQSGIDRSIERIQDMNINNQEELEKLLQKEFEELIEFATLEGIAKISEEELQRFLLAEIKLFREEFEDFLENKHQEKEQEEKAMPVEEVQVSSNLGGPAKVKTEILVEAHHAGRTHNGRAPGVIAAENARSHGPFNMNYSGTRIDSDIQGGIYTGSRFAEVSLGNANFTKLTINSCNMSGTDWRKSNWTNINVGSTSAFEGADFRLANMDSVRFSVCNLKYTDWSNSKLMNLTFSDVYLTGALFHGATLENVEMKQVWGLTLEMFQGASLDGVMFPAGFTLPGTKIVDGKTYSLDKLPKEAQAAHRKETVQVQPAKIAMNVNLNERMRKTMGIQDKTEESVFSKANLKRLGKKGLRKAAARKAADYTNQALVAFVGKFAKGAKQKASIMQVLSRALASDEGQTLVGFLVGMAAPHAAAMVTKNESVLSEIKEIGDEMSSDAVANVTVKVVNATEDLVKVFMPMIKEMVSSAETLTAAEESIRVESTTGVTASDLELEEEVDTESLKTSLRKA